MRKQQQHPALGSDEKKNATIFICVVEPSPRLSPHCPLNPLQTSTTTMMNTNTRLSFLAILLVVHEALAFAPGGNASSRRFQTKLDASALIVQNKGGGHGELGECHRWERCVGNGHDDGILSWQNFFQDTTVAMERSISICRGCCRTHIHD